jgi:hypothetical protein
MLEAHSTATLATAGPDGPWAAAIFYASDPELNLYFVSDRRTRHARHLAAHPRAAAAIHPDCKTWAEVRGLQLAGPVELLEGPGRAAGLEHYLSRLQDVKRLLALPRDADEEHIARRLRSAGLYRLRPDWIRLIDNARGFGFKEEIVLR